MKEQEKARVTWQTEERVLTLEGEPVLRYTLTWPEVTGAGAGGRRISRYYARLARLWGRRWQREVYWKACLALAQCRGASRLFVPWEGGLKGEVALWRDGLLSLRMEGWEVRGNGKPNRVRWGDVWKVREGAPCPLKEWMPKGRRWKRLLLADLFQQGQQRKAAGEYAPDPDWGRKLNRFFPGDGYCLTPEGLEFAYPQCSIAPAAEGTPVFQVSREALSSPCKAQKKDFSGRWKKRKLPLDNLK